MQSFIWGGNTGRTYQDMVRQRQQAQQMQQGIDKVSGPGGGLNALAKGFTSNILNRRANETEGQLTSDFKKDWDQEFGGSVLGQQFAQRFGGRPFGEGLAAPEQGSFPASLIETESGGNWNALNNEMGAGGRGHGGRLQFGHARLQDAANAGVIPPMTPQEFAQQPPEVQQRVENWHFADIDQQAQQRGLNSFVGQNVGGVPITQDAIRGMAHLGGIGGAQRFLESGGQHNPSDSFGTSLRDYGLRHGGGQATVQPASMNPGPSIAGLARLMANPIANEGQRSVLAAMLQQQMQQQDPMYRAQLQRAQFDLEQDRLGLGRDSRVQSSDILDDGTIVTVMSDGSSRVLSPTGETLTGQAAADAIRSAREYGVDNQRAIYGGRREGTLGADIDLGGQARAVEDVAAATVSAGVDAWESYGKIQSNIGNLDDAIAALDNGAKSGLIYNMLPNVTEASASLQNAMDRMGLDIIGMVTFGALSEGEMRLAMETAVPRNLQGDELRSWLVSKRDAQQKAAQALADAAQYMMTPGNTINGWIERNKVTGQAQAAPQGQPTIRTWTPDGGLQ